MASFSPFQGSCASTLVKISIEIKTLFAALNFFKSNWKLGIWKDQTCLKL